MVSKILIRDDGYINATALCQQANKEFKDWKRNQVTFEFLQGPVVRSAY